MGQLLLSVLGEASIAKGIGWTVTAKGLLGG